MSREHTRGWPRAWAEKGHGHAERTQHARKPEKQGSRLVEGQGWLEIVAGGAHGWEKGLGDKERSELGLAPRRQAWAAK